MKKSRATKIIERIAVAEGVNVSDVRRDMAAAIEHGYANRNSKTAKFWAQWSGRKPSVEEFIIATRGETLSRIGRE